MADRGSRIATALNFLTNEGISYYLDGCDHYALEALIEDYFNTRVVTTELTALMKATRTVKV